VGVTGTGDPTSGPESEPSSGDHYRANGEGSLPPGYYRVVGRNGECVTLLHVGDKEGRRRHTGRVESVDRSDLAALDAAEAPASSAGAGVASVVEALWLSLRMVPGNLRDRPAQVLLAVVLLGGAALGPAFVAAPPLVFEAADLLGALLLGAAAAGIPR